MFYKLCFRLLANNEQMFIIFIYFDEISRIHFRLNYVILKKNKITWGKTILSFLFKENNFKPFPTLFLDFHSQEDYTSPTGYFAEVQASSEMAPTHTPVKSRCHRRQCV